MKKCMVIALLLAVVILSACDNSKPAESEPQPTIIEPGYTDSTPNQTDTPQETVPGEETGPQDGFTDKGRASTVEDLMRNKSLISSYYYEQTIGYEAGDIYIKTWYLDGVMKIESSYPGAPPTVDYFDCQEYVLVTYTPSTSDNAVMITYEEGDPEVPGNPLAYNYFDYRVQGTDSIDGQTCRVLEGPAGDKLWVSTENGFPMQLEFTDSLTEEHFIVPYENIALNQVSPAEVAIPENLVIYEMIGGGGY